MRTVQELADELNRHSAFRGASRSVRRHCDQALEALDRGHLPLDRRSWSDLERFLQQRAQALDPTATDDYLRAIDLLGELLGVTGHQFDPSLRTGEALAVGDTELELADDAGVESQAPWVSALDFTATAPQLELHWNPAGWAEVCWHGFVADDDLTDALRVAWRVVRVHDSRCLLLDLSHATALTDRDAQWLHDWLSVLQRDPLCRVALLGERGLLQRIFPRRANEIARVTPFLQARAARQWLADAPLCTTPDNRVIDFDAGSGEPDLPSAALAWRRRPARARAAQDEGADPSSTAAATPRARRPLMRRAQRSDPST